MEDGMETLRESGVQLILKGITTVEEVLTYTIE
jgi:type II secretory ATPase GspE/PulE/Tfp pilus assembly ATPase PilB-like protein